MTADQGLIRLSAVLPCPECQRRITCRWTEGHETASQQCPSCGHVFEATWPGFIFEPETIIVRPPGQEPGDEAG